MPESIAVLFKQGPAKIDTLTVDATISESHVTEMEITDHPVERGADISDHARPKPNKLTLECVVSNTPLSSQQEKRTVNVLGARLDVNSAASQPRDRMEYAVGAYETLLAIKDAAKLITVVTSLVTYDDMMIEQLSVPRDAKTGDAIKFQLVLKQVRLIASKVSTSVVAKEPKAKKKVEDGKKPTTKTAASTDDKVKKSWATQILEEYGIKIGR